jgi:hypothetical protein
VERKGCAVVASRSQYKVPAKVEAMDPKDYWTSIEYQNNHRFKVFWTHDNKRLGKQHLIQKCLKCLEIPQ